MPNIYIVKTHQANFINLIIELLVQTAGKRIYGPGNYDLNSSKFFSCKPSNRPIKHWYTGTWENFRNHKWSDDLESLMSAVNEAKLTNSIIVFGSHQVDQINFLKSIFKDDLFSISINYSNKEYPVLLNHLAEYHYYLLKNNFIKYSEVDFQILNNKSYNEIISYYSQSFDDQSLIPKMSLDYLDYNINILDIFDKDLLIKHFFQIGLPLSSESLSYYDNWVKLFNSSIV
jgi:hypothetical protein